MKLNPSIHQTLSRLPGVAPLLAVALGFLSLTPGAQAAPPVTADLALHLDAAQLTGLNDGDTVNTWTDMSGLGNNAVRTGGTPTYKTGIINGQRGVTADTALRLGHWFGTSPQFWMNLQQMYELRVAEREVGAQIAILPKRAGR